MSELKGWMFRAARAGADAKAEDLVAAAGIGLSTLKKIEASDVIEVRDDPKRKIDGGIAPDVIERLLAELRRRGFELRVASEGWPEAVVRVPYKR